MNDDGRIVTALRREVSDWRRWTARAVVMAVAVAAGLTVVGFTWLTERASARFESLQSLAWWSPLLLTPALAALIVWITRRYVPGAAGSGIPQVMAALEASVPRAERGLYVSLRLSAAKIVLTAAGLLGGLSLGREGPSVQVAAGLMHSVRRWLPRRSAVTEQGLLVAGGAAGIAAAFNTPLAGVMFAIEELSRAPEQRNSGLIISAIVLAGLVAVSISGNATYFGVIRVPEVGWSLLGRGLSTAVVGGLAGGLFSRLLLASVGGRGGDAFTRWRRQRPVAFAAGCGLAVALIGVVTHGDTFGSGYTHARAMLEGDTDTPLVYALFKFIATWLTTWSGVPAGVFAPSLAIGAALGHDMAALTGEPQAAALIAVGMAAFLAAVTQAPLTSFIIVMEMIDGHAMVLSLMASALIASALSRLLSAPLYPSLARMQLGRLGEAGRDSASAVPSAAPGAGSIDPDAARARPPG